MSVRPVARLWCSSALTSRPLARCYPQSLDAKPLASLVLPSQFPHSPATASHRTSSPSPTVISPAHPPSRSSTPFAERERQRIQAQPPPLDRARATQVVDLVESDLALLSLDRLKRLREEIDRISADASEALTFALVAREKEAADAETYNGMISVSFGAGRVPVSVGGGGGC